MNPTSAGFPLLSAAPRHTWKMPSAMHTTAGQKLKKNSNPGPIGFGFGHRPMPASTMISSSGDQPTSRPADQCDDRADPEYAVVPIVLHRRLRRANTGFQLTPGTRALRAFSVDANGSESPE
ncbi:hypothetical protein [Denitratimonas sp. CY0512]|uniref:hypothetical protein n=1 Tax=Denitratimonas sp. CY0512 TaxID=3131940 RepID=UPI0030A17A8A